MSQGYQVYGRFISGKVSPDNIILSEAGKEECHGILGLDKREADRRFSLGHRFYRAMKEGTECGSFWLGSGGSYEADGENHSLQGYIYDLHGEDPLPIARASESLLSKRLLVVDKQPPSSDFCVLGKASSSAPLMFSLRKPGDDPASRMKSIARSIAPSLSAFAFSILQRYRSRRFLIGGTFAGQKISASFFGPEPFARFYLGLFFDSATLSAPAGFFETVEKDLSSKKVDWAMTVCKQADSGRFKDALMLPSFVRALHRIKSSFEEYLDTLCKSGKSDIAKIRKQGFSAEISTDPLDLLLFYECMYIPMLRTRHSRDYILLGYPELEEHFKKGSLLFVKKERFYLGGMLIRGYGKRLLFKVLGISGGSFALTRSGVNSALAYFSIKHAFENGYREFDFGLSGPVHSDGLVFFKNKWGARFVADDGAQVLCILFASQERKKEFVTRFRPFLIGEIQEAGPLL